MVRQFQEYVEPDESSQRRQNPASRSDDEVLLPLGETTLTHNLGIPIVVVVTKVSPFQPGKPAFLAYQHNKPKMYGSKLKG